MDKAKLIELADYPSWICCDCGDKRGRRRGDVATFHYGTCGWCGLNPVPVTEPRDYGYPKWRALAEEGPPPHSPAIPASPETPT